MIIDCHGHYTTEPEQLTDYRKSQLAGLDADPSFLPTRADLNITDDEIRERIEPAQIKLQQERGTDMTIFSPRAVGMGHHLGTEQTGYYWAEICNNMVRRVCDLYPDRFVPVCQLPQYPGVEPAKAIPELERCVNEMGFIGVNVNPDPSGAMWTDPPITDKWWYPLWEKMVELEVPGMLHVSELPSDRYRFNARNQSLDGKRRGNRFALGDKIEVTIGEIFELEGKISLYY